MIKEYGSVFAGYWCATWVGGLVLIWGGMKIGQIHSWELIKHFLQLENFITTETLDMVDPDFVDIIVAMEINGLFDIVRIPLVISTTPRVANWIRERRQRKKEEQVG
eukprot:c15692_g1_i1.p1 GENE.c15692_g1_i1~~c15692_g1_i1.p1  ORF type:complete len:107 (+),score=19.28 c15692_g1_i1:235-555(+)